MGRLSYLEAHFIAKHSIYMHELIPCLFSNS